MQDNNLPSIFADSVSPLERRKEFEIGAGNCAKREEGASMPSYESSMRNLAKASQKFRPPRPWRSSQEFEMVPRFQWFTCRDSRRPLGRNWAKQLGISHTWLQRLVREFMADPTEMLRLQTSKGDPKFAELSRAREYSLRMKERGELRARQTKKGRAQE